MRYNCAKFDITFPSGFTSGAPSQESESHLNRGVKQACKILEINLLNLTNFL